MKKKLRNRIIIFHNHIRFIKGFCKNILINTNQQFYLEINNETYNLLNEAKIKSIDFSLKNLNKNDKKKFIDFLYYLENLRYIIFANKNNHFQNIMISNDFFCTIKLL